MTVESTSSTFRDSEHDLAMIHIGMLLGSYAAEDTLPNNMREAANLVSRLFGVFPVTEPNVHIVRNKMVAIIEKINSDSKGH